MSDLIQIVDAALADAARRSGDWLVCRPGCAQCCAGVFQISALDAARLREGLDAADPGIADAVLARVCATRGRLDSWFPGDLASGLLRDDEEAVELFEEFAADEICPVLNPETLTCDLYAHRPILCRTFGPPVRNEDDGLAICELCFDGASEAETLRCEMDSSFRALEAREEDRYAAAHPESGVTMVAYAFASGSDNGTHETNDDGCGHGSQRRGLCRGNAASA